MGLHEIIVELQHVLATAEKNNVDLTERAIGGLDDFAKQRQEGTRLALTGILQRLRNAAQNTDLAPIVQKLANAQTVKEMKVLLEELAEQVVPEKPAERRIQFNPRTVPNEIREEIHADLTEAQKCMNSECYRSAVILCGRVLETALHRKYFDATGNDLLEKAPGIGLGNLIAKLSDKGVTLDPGLSNQIHLINQLRIYSVHKKQETFVPSRAQAEAIVLYTLDVLEKLFR